MFVLFHPEVSLHSWLLWPMVRRAPLPHILILTGQFQLCKGVHIIPTILLMPPPPGFSHLPTVLVSELNRVGLTRLSQ